MALFVSSLMAVHINTALWRRNFRVNYNESLSKYRLTVWNSLFLFIHQQLIWGLSPSLGLARHKTAVRHSNMYLLHIGCVKIHISRACLDSRHHHVLVVVVIIIIIIIIISVMELGHLLTRSGLTYPEVSSKVCHDSFWQLEKNVSLPWVIYYEEFYLHVVSSFSSIPVICPKLVLF